MGPVTATLPVVPVSVQSGVPPLGGAAVGQESAAPAVPALASIAAAAVKQAANAATENVRTEFTAVTLPARRRSSAGGRGWRRGTANTVGRGGRSQI